MLFDCTSLPERKPVCETITRYPACGGMRILPGTVTLRTRIAGSTLLLISADVRSNLVERIWLTGRRRLATGVFRSMESDPFVVSSERSFREFMKAINLLGGGIVFEAMTDAEIDAFLARCSAQAATELAASAAAKL